MGTASYNRFSTTSAWIPRRIRDKEPFPASQNACNAALLEALQGIRHSREAPQIALAVQSQDEGRID